MAGKQLTREEMAKLRRDRRGISRGAFNRTLGQARSNISESIHTVLVLGYSGLLESPSLAPLLEASERLKSQTLQLRRGPGESPQLYRSMIESLLDDLERAYDALMGKSRDT